MRHPVFIALGCSKQGRRKIMAVDSIRWNKERKSGRRGEEEDALARGFTVSATETGKEGARVRELGQRRLAGLGPGGRGEKGEKRAARGRQAGRCWAAAGLGLNRIGEMKILFFFLFQYFKAFSKLILNSLFNLIQTTQYKISNAAA
jgi:hypothetical protein